MLILDSHTLSMIFLSIAFWAAVFLYIGPVIRIYKKIVARLKSPEDNKE